VYVISPHHVWGSIDLYTPDTTITAADFENFALEYVTPLPIRTALTALYDEFPVRLAQHPFHCLKHDLGKERKGTGV